MQGVPGKIFAPMSVTYGFALTGALIFALVFAPVLGSLAIPKRFVQRCQGNVAQRLLSPPLRHAACRRTLRFSGLVLDRSPSPRWSGRCILFHSSAVNSCPRSKKATCGSAPTCSRTSPFRRPTKLADDIRATLRAYPEVTQVVSQMGRPDDGTDVSTFNNIEFLADLKPRLTVASAVPRQQRRADRRHLKELSAVPRHRFQFLPEHSGQRGRSDVRRQRRELAQALRQRLRRAYRASPIRSPAS